MSTPTAHHRDYRFRCVTCGREFSREHPPCVCRDCARTQAPGRSLRGVLEILYDFHRLNPFAVAEHLAASRERGMRRYLGFLPVEAETPLPPLLVGDTPLYPSRRLGERLGLRRLFFKDDTRNPTGSLKDRASFLVVAKALEARADTICTASTGNAATALAALAASAGVRCVVLVPAAAPPAKLAQMLVCGARVVPVDGTYDQAFDLSIQACEAFGWMNRNTAYNPYTIDGKRTAAFETWEQLDGRAPESFWVGTGDGVIVAGLTKGFRDLRAMGLIDALPRPVACQPEGSSALVRALEAGATDPEPMPGARSVADSLVVEAPRNGILALRDLRDADGRGVRVSDEEILAAMALLGADEGLFVEPSSAAAVAGLIREREAGRVGDDELAVVVLTGTGLKDPDSAWRTVRVPAAVRPNLDGVLGALREE